MKKQFIVFLILVFILGLVPINFSKAANIAARVKGKILLQVESNGEAWYVNPDNEKRYYLGRPVDAFQVMRELGLGISNKDFNSYNVYAPSRLSGKILLKVEDSGKAYYVNPTDFKMHYLGKPDDAFKIMRELGLGVSNNNLGTIVVADGYDIKTTDTQIKKEGIVENKTNEIINNVDEKEDVANKIVSGTEIQGIISQDTIWTLEKSPYIVKKSILVEENITLTIEPGVNILVDRGMAPENGVPGANFIEVRGSLLANGTPSRKIIFTSSETNPQSRDWRGIIHENIKGVVEISYCDISYADVVSLNQVDKFNHNKVAYGGFGVMNAGEIMNNIIEYNYYGIDTQKIGDDNFKYNIQNNIIRFNETMGIRLQTEAAVIKNNIINNNGEGIQMGRDTSNAKITMNNIYNNNYYNAICLDETCNLGQNWWGTTDLSEIEKKLYDSYSQFGTIKINYKPILQSEVEINL